MNYKVAVHIVQKICILKIKLQEMNMIQMILKIYLINNKLLALKVIKLMKIRARVKENLENTCNK
jgi:hypothetical protein